MERLTYKSSLGDYGSAKEFDSEFIEKCALRNALGKYEDLQCTPEEIKKYMPKFPIGSTVYKIYVNRVFSLRVTGFRVEYSDKKYKLYISYTETDPKTRNAWSLFVNDWIEEDDGIYATEEEALEALGTVEKG